MEKNQVYNRELKEALVNAAIGVLMDNELITKEDFVGLGIGMGYLFSTEEDQIEGLFQVSFSGKTYFFAAQKGKLMMVNISQEQYEQTVEYMKSYHPCILSEELPETELQKNRREKNNRIVGGKGIAFEDRAMTRWEDERITVRDTLSVCKRMMTCFLVTQIACDIGNGNYQEGLDYFAPKLESNGLMDCLNSKEKRIVDGTYSMQDAIDMDWAYEDFWALCWCLGFVEDISDAGNVCDCDKAIKLMQSCDSVQKLVEKSKPRSKAEILDMLDLYYRYHWAINEAKVHPETPLGDLDHSTVLERRRGLEWIVSDVEDWYDLTLPA